MKRNTILLFLLMMTVWSFAEDVKIIRMMTDGTEVAEYYSADIESLVIFDSDSNGYRTQDIRGLEKLKHLKVLVFQTLPFLKNYDFLKEVSTVEELYFGSVHFSDFSARKGATLSGLQRLTGKDWRDSNWNKKRDPKTLQVGETVDTGKRTLKPEDAIVVNNTAEAKKLYFGGNESSVWLSDEIFDAVKNGPVTTNKINNRIKTGATELAKGNWGEDLTNIENMWFVGKTNIDYKIYTGTDFTIVDMSAFVRDGCWDVIPGEGGDTTGPKKELPFGSPYPFLERSWSISFPNPEKVNWK